MFAVCTARLRNRDKLLVAADGTTHIIISCIFFFNFMQRALFPKVDMFKPFLESPRPPSHKKRRRERESHTPPPPVSDL